MTEAVFAVAGLAETHADLMRNIVSLRVSENLFDDLSAAAEDWDAAIALERMSKPQLFASPLPVIHRPFEEAHWNDAIAFPFRHWLRSRYSDGSYGVWYGSDAVETTVHETVYHWRQGLLADAGYDQPGIRIERKLYRVRCDAALVDLRPALKRFPALVHPADYTLTQQVGAKLRHEGHPGLVSKSARCEGEVCAVFNAQVLSNPRAVGYLSYTTTQDGVRVERQPGRTWLRLR